MNNNFKCNICEKEFTTKHLLIKHTNRKKSCYYDRRDIIEEQIKGFNNKLKNDDNTSISSNKHICTYCKTPYSNKSNLKTHLKKNCNKRNELSIRLNSFQQELIIVNNKIIQIEGVKEEVILSHKDDVQLNKETLIKFDKEILIQMLLEKDINKDINKDVSKAVKEKETKSKSVTNNTNNINGDNNTTNNINNQQINNVTNNIQINLNNYDEPNCDFLTMEQKNKFLKDRYKGLIDFITYVYFNESYPEKSYSFIY